MSEDKTMANAHVTSEASVRDFLAALGTAETTHGAVSAAAVAGGMGVSLLLMVAALPTTRSDSPAERTALMGASADLSDIQQQLIETIETETAVRLYAARQMPHASATERAARDQAMQLASRAAADVPVEVSRLCARALEQARTVAGCSCRAAASEIELAIALLRVAFTGARGNLESRLSRLTDVAYAQTVVEEIARLSEVATDAARTAELAVQPPPA
jgi:formiminotetrahydrofolate cyclodeaminase